MKELKNKVRENLRIIREILDADVIDSNIEMIQNKALKLTQLSGLASECKAAARKVLENARLLNLSEIQHEKVPVSMLMKKLDAMCADELALYEYSDRINASITHNLDTLRSIISLYKEELRNNFEPSNTY